MVKGYGIWRTLQNICDRNDVWNIDQRQCWFILEATSAEWSRQIFLLYRKSTFTIVSSNTPELAIPIQHYKKNNNKIVIQPPFFGFFPSFLFVILQTCYLLGSIFHKLQDRAKLQVHFRPWMLLFSIFPPIILAIRGIYCGQARDFVYLNLINKLVWN